MTNRRPQAHRLRKVHSSDLPDCSGPEAVTSELTEWQAADDSPIAPKEDAGAEHALHGAGWLRGPGSTGRHGRRLAARAGGGRLECRRAGHARHGTMGGSQAL